MTPALVVCAHGTRDPDGRATVRAVVAEVAALLPGVDVLEAYVDVHGPEVADVVAGLPPGEPLAGVVVPLLLAGGYHVHVDIAEVVAARPDVVATPALGPDERLVEVVLDRVASLRPIEPGRYDPVSVFWAHGPSALVVEMEAGPVEEDQASD